jgi:hypothetical protein
VFSCTTQGVARTLNLQNVPEKLKHSMNPDYVVALLRGQTKVFIVESENIHFSIANHTNNFLDIAWSGC